MLKSTDRRLLSVAPTAQLPELIRSFVQELRLALHFCQRGDELAAQLRQFGLFLLEFSSALVDLGFTLVKLGRDRPQDAPLLGQFLDLRLRLRQLCILISNG